MTPVVVFLELVVQLDRAEALTVARASTCSQM